MSGREQIEVMKKGARVGKRLPMTTPDGAAPSPSLAPLTVAVPTQAHESRLVELARSIKRDYSGLGFAGRV